jgi:fatty-acid desaturase
MGWYLIVALESVGLASGVKRPNMARINGQTGS